MPPSTEEPRRSRNVSADIRLGSHLRTFGEPNPMSALPSIVLQNSKVAGPRLFREDSKRGAIAEPCNLNRVTEVACEFDARQ